MGRLKSNTENLSLFRFKQKRQAKYGERTILVSWPFSMEYDANKKDYEHIVKCQSIAARVISVQD